MKIYIDDAEASEPSGYFAEMSEAEAVALAQLCKRITFTDLRSCSVDNDEAYVMRDAVEKLQAALRSAGYAPR
jgi:thiazole synthase ThiGH ThiG subunit